MGGCLRYDFDLFKIFYFNSRIDEEERQMKRNRLLNKNKIAGTYVRHDRVSERRVNQFWCILNDFFTFLIALL